MVVKVYDSVGGSIDQLNSLEFFNVLQPDISLQSAWLTVDSITRIYSNEWLLGCPVIVESKIKNQRGTSLRFLIIPGDTVIISMSGASTNIGLKLLSDPSKSELSFLEKQYAPAINQLKKLSEGNDVALINKVSNHLTKLVDSLYKSPTSNRFFNALCLYWLAPLGDAELLEKIAQQDSYYNLGGNDYMDKAKETITAIKNRQKGSLAPDFTFFTKENGLQKLSDFRGKWVLLDFWASWCKPCRENNAYLNEANEIYGKQGLTIISYSLDKDTIAWNKAVADDRMTWLQTNDTLSLEGKAAGAYKVETLPRNILIGPDGLIKAVNLEKLELLKTIRLQLQQNKKYPLKVPATKPKESKF